jgi:NAD(P)-dependent dehydrogenase (short-subunit alcohol dehydrogenase family)
MCSTTMRMFRAAAAHTFCHEKLEVLISLSGVMYTPPEMITEQGYDIQFGTNVLGVCTKVIYYKHHPQ